MTTTYLYIPFKENEDPSELVISAKKWRYMFENKELMREVLTEDTEDPYHPREIVVCFAGENKLQNVKEGDSVYVLAHGMQDTNDVCNKRMNEDSIISQEVVADRLKSDGFPKDTECKLKLYYCDESNNADKRMTEFYQAFNTEGFSKVKSFYYPGVIVSTPTITDKLLDPLKSHKRAYIKLNLLELERNQLKKILREQIAKMDTATLNSFLLSLGYKVIMQLIEKSDPVTLKLMCEKAQITNVNQFLMALRSEKQYSDSLMLELGKAKDFRKQFTPNSDKVDSEKKPKPKGKKDVQV